MLDRRRTAGRDPGCGWGSVTFTDSDGELDRSRMRLGSILNRPVDALRAQTGLSETDRKAAAKVLDSALRPFGLTTPQTKAVWDALAVRDADAPAVSDKKGNPEPDAELRDGENVPLPTVRAVFEADPTERLRSIEYRSAVDDYLAAEVLPYVPDAWVDHDKTKISYEIPLTRHFYKYVPPRQVAKIDAELKALEAEIQELLREVTE